MKDLLRDIHNWLVPILVHALQDECSNKLATVPHNCKGIFVSLLLDLLELLCCF